MNRGIVIQAEFIEQGIVGLNEIKFERDAGMIIQGETIGNSVYSHSMLGAGRSMTGTPPHLKQQANYKSGGSSRLALDPAIFEDKQTVKMNAYKGK